MSLFLSGKHIQPIGNPAPEIPKGFHGHLWEASLTCDKYMTTTTGNYDVYRVKWDITKAYIRHDYAVTTTIAILLQLLHIHT